MALLKMPSVVVTFKELGITAIERSEHGILAMVFSGDDKIDKQKIYSTEDIPEDAADYTKEQIKLALIGYQTTPKYILTFNAKSTTTSTGGSSGGVSTNTTIDYTDVLKTLAATKFDWVVFPGIEANKTQDIVTWIKAQRTNDHLIKAVLPNTAADTEGIVNYTNAYVKVGDKSYKTTDFCSRVAGIICGTPSTISCTYAPVPEATEVELWTQDEMDNKVGNGEFFFFNDGEKIKVARGINSYVTTVQGKGDDFKKIKLVDLLDMMKGDIEKTAHDSYIGKYANSEDNRALLVSAINGYFMQLEQEGLLEVNQNTCEINIDAVKAWRVSNGLNTKDEVMAMADKEVKALNIHDNVFLKAHVSPLDAIENIDLLCEVE